MPGGAAVRSSGGDGCSGSFASARGRELFLETPSQPCPDARAEGPGEQTVLRGKEIKTKEFPESYNQLSELVYVFLF